ncbi:MAG TPA: ATP-binding protein [Roseiflexaceae bacterium]|nr:ATP-binding protein [Roseiflexaceae bacterium]
MHAPEQQTAPDIRACALAAVAATLPPRGPGAPHAAELDFLARQHRRAGGAEWPETLLALLADPDGHDRPLVQISQTLALSAHEILALALALAVEDDPLAGRALARVQTSGKAPGPAHPTLGLVGALLGGASPIALASGTAAGSGLLLLGGEGALPERTLSLPPHLAAALAGLDVAPPGTWIDQGEGLALPESVCAEAVRHAATLAEGEQTLVLRAGPAEGRAVAGELARGLGLRPLLLDGDRLPAGLGPLLLLRGLLPVRTFELTPGERGTAPSIPFYSGPLICICTAEGLIDSSRRAGAAVSWTLPIPTLAERAALWRHTLGPDADTGAARSHRHSAERIAELGRLARYQANLRGASCPSAEDLRQATRGTALGLEALAQPLPDEIPESALVLPDELRADLELLYLRCLVRDGLPDELGLSARARYTPGVRALFSGPSGTGKSLAAGWLATRLGLPLYRVDLASVTSKYIGETEKNLADLLARAERAGVLLLFDEADALFGKRTDIKDSHDRFANAQTNYLLQRIETFDGIAILTSNSRQRFDSAFARRLDALIEFPLPDTRQRRALWEAHLGSAHRLDSDQLDRLALAADLAGGHIRNSALTAAVLAQAERRPIGYSDVLRGLAVEFAKLGRQLPAGLWPSGGGGV